MTLTFLICAVTGVFVFLSVLLFPSVKIGRVTVGSYWLISAAGALLLLFTGCLPLSAAVAEITRSGSMNPLKILLLFFSMTSLSVFLDEVGFFRYLANLALRKTGKNQTVLFVTVYALVSILTVFTSNDIVVLTFTPFICFFAKEADIDPMPYLFGEFVASNTWSMLLVIGNPTNIYLSQNAGIDFIRYIAVMWLPTLFAGAVSFSLLYVLFRKSLKKPLSPATRPAYIEDKPALTLGILHLGVCTLLLAVSSYIGLSMHWVAAGAAASLFLLVTLCGLWRRQPLDAVLRVFRRLPYELVPFVLSMFVLVTGLSYSGIAKTLAELLFSFPTVPAFGLSSFLVSNVINNIPMSVLFSTLIAEGGAGAEALPAVYASVIGSNIGAFFTQVGALAGIMWATILRRFRVDFSFKKFVLYGVILSFPTLCAALLGLWIIL